MIVSNGTALDFAPQALGEITPTLANGYFYSQQGLNLIGHFAVYGALYRSQPSVATLVDKIANSAARLTVKLWDTTPETGKVQDKDSAFSHLLAFPCTEMSPYNFWRWTFSTYEVYGEAFWWKQRADQSDPKSPVTNLLPMHPSRVAVHRDVDGNVEYVFTLGVASAGILRAPAGDVVAFLRYNPDNLMRGLSRLEALATTLKNEDAARRASESWWRRGARPSLVLTHPNELSQPAMDALKASVDARQAGADQMGGSMILQEGMTATLTQLTADEMQYIESRKMNLQEVCMVYDVPPPVVHILDHATFSNITEQMRSMYRDTMSPRLEDVESTIDFSLTSEFFAPGKRETEFDMTEVLRGDFETRADKAVTLRQSGIYTGNQALEIIGAPRSTDPEMDKLYANAALVLLGTPAQRVSITEAAPPNPALVADVQGTLAKETVSTQDATQSATAIKSVTAQTMQLREVLGKVGRVKASEAAIRKSMQAQHLTALTGLFGEQKAAAKMAPFDAAAWNPPLTKILHVLALATAHAVGNNVAKRLGGQFSADSIVPYLATNAATSAKKINDATAAELLAAIQDQSEEEQINGAVDDVFDNGMVSARAGQISDSRVAMIGGLAALVAARLANATTKTWVTGDNPRPSHAMMDGETVALGEQFSNGMDGPGDYTGGAEEVANCNCSLDFSTEDQTAQDIANASGNADPQEWVDAFEENVPQDYRLFVNHYTPDEVAAMKARYLANNGTTGLLVTDHGNGNIEMTGLFNKKGGVPGAIGPLINKSIANDGVNYAECMGDPLRIKYESYGFHVIDAQPFKAEYAPDGWDITTMGEPPYYKLSNLPLAK